MGQNKSLPDPEQTFCMIHGKLQTQLGIIKRLATLTYDEFQQSVSELNSMTATFTDHKGKQLRFSVESGTDTTVLWKTLVRVRCEKINVRRNMLESTRTLNLKQYILLYKEITEQVSNLTRDTSSPGPGPRLRSDICASTIFDGATGPVNVSEDDECCICMDNKSEIILPCAHKFCEECIDCWNVTSKTCPICRAHVKSSDDTWVLTEKPDNAAYASEVKGYLVGLADRPKQQ